MGKINWKRYDTETLEEFCKAAFPGDNIMLEKAKAGPKALGEYVKRYIAEAVVQAVDEELEYYEVEED